MTKRFDLALDVVGFEMLGICGCGLALVGEDLLALLGPLALQLVGDLRLRHLRLAFRSVGSRAIAPTRFSSATTFSRACSASSTTHALGGARLSERWWTFISSSSSRRRL